MCVGHPLSLGLESGALPLKRAMTPADFRGLYFYKLLIPAFTWGSILGTFLGPFFFPAAWFLFVAAFMVVFVLVSLSQVLKMLILHAFETCAHTPGIIYGRYNICGSYISLSAENFNQMLHLLKAAILSLSSYKDPDCCAAAEDARHDQQDTADDS